MIAISAANQKPSRIAADAIEQLVRIAIAYCHFAATNKNLWRALFEHQMANEKPVPTTDTLAIQSGRSSSTSMANMQIQTYRTAEQPSPMCIGT